MKKITVFVLAAVLALSLAACGSDSSGTSAASDTQSSSAQQTVETSDKSEAAVETAEPAVETSEASNSPEVTPEETKEAEEGTAEDGASEETSEETAEEDKGELSEEAAEAEKSLLPLVTGDYTIDECMKLGNYKGLEAEYSVEEVTDDEVEAEIEAYLVAEALDDPDAVVEEGVTVDIDYEGYMDGEQVDNATGNINTLVIGSGSFIAGFEEGLIGMKVGEERDLDLRFPDDYWNPEMASKDIRFHVTLNSIMVVPEMTDEWAQRVTNSEFTTLDDFRAAMRAEMEEDARQTAMDTLENNLWNQVYENSEFYKLPSTIVDTAVARYMDNYNYYASMYGMTLSDYLSMGYGISLADFEVYSKQYGQSIAKSQLLRDAIWEAEGLSMEDEEYKAREEELAEIYGVSIEELNDYFGEDEVQGYCKTYCDIDRIKSYAVITGLDED